MTAGRTIRFGDVVLVADRIVGFRTVATGGATLGFEVPVEHHVVALAAGIGAIVLDSYPTEAAARAYLDQLERELETHLAKAAEK